MTPSESAALHAHLERLVTLGEALALAIERQRTLLARAEQELKEMAETCKPS